MQSDRPSYDARLAQEAALVLKRYLESACSRIEIAGSLRRRKRLVHDIELLYVPIFEDQKNPSDMFGSIRANLVDQKLAELLVMGTITRRKTKLGSHVWGEKIKLAVHRPTGIPVDFFSINESGWFSYLVCRTGPAQHNIRLAMAAKARGMKWEPYEGLRTNGTTQSCTSEEDLFERVGWKYCEPWDRR